MKYYLVGALMYLAAGAAQKMAGYALWDGGPWWMLIPGIACAAGFWAGLEWVRSSAGEA